MNTNDHHITDLPSFERVAGKNGGIAALYFWCKLDCLVDLAYAVTTDFFARPQLYTAVPEHTSEDIAMFRARCGTDERIPSLAQRSEIFVPIFGGTGAAVDGGAGQFCQLRDALFEAALRFRDRPADEGVGMLREDLRLGAATLGDWLRGLVGASVRWSSGHALPRITEGLAYQILRRREVRAVFGVDAEPDATWPYWPSAAADTFVEAASRQLIQSGSSPVVLNRATIAGLQRAAARGAEALAVVMDADDDSNLDADVGSLVAATYAWWSALGRIGPSQADGVGAATTNGMTRDPYMGANVVSLRA
jgi:hypothetical protein